MSPGWILVYPPFCIFMTDLMYSVRSHWFTLTVHTDFWFLSVPTTMLSALTLPITLEMPRLSAGCSHGCADLPLNPKYPLAIFPIGHIVLFLFLLVLTFLLCDLIFLSGGIPLECGWAPSETVFSTLLVLPTSLEAPILIHLVVSDLFLRTALLTGVLCNVAPASVDPVCLCVIKPHWLWLKSIHVRLFWTQEEQGTCLLAECWLTWHTDIPEPQLHPS